MGLIMQIPTKLKGVAITVTKITRLERIIPNFQQYVIFVEGFVLPFQFLSQGESQKKGFDRDPNFGGSCVPKSLPLKVKLRSKFFKLLEVSKGI